MEPRKPVVVTVQDTPGLPGVSEQYLDGVAGPGQVAERSEVP